MNRVIMFRKSMILTLLVCLFFSSAADAKRGHKRSHHRSHSHYYHRNNNASKQEACTEGYVDYFGICGTKKVKQVEEPKPSTQSKKMNKTASRSKAVQPDLQPKKLYQSEKPKPRCAPLYMAHKPGYTNLPICTDSGY